MFLPQYETCNHMWVCWRMRGTAGANVQWLYILEVMCYIDIFDTTAQIGILAVWDAWRVWAENVVVVMAMRYLEEKMTAHHATMILLHRNSIWSWWKRRQIKVDSRHFRAIAIVSFEIQCAGALKPTQQKNCRCPDTFSLHCVVYGRIVSSSSGRVVLCIYKCR